MSFNIHYSVEYHSQNWGNATLTSLKKGKRRGRQIMRKSGSREVNQLKDNAGWEENSITMDMLLTPINCSL